MAMTAEQLIERAVTCVTCGKVHQPHQITPHQQTWAGKDGHPYRTRLYAMTGDSCGRAIEALRLIAAGLGT